MCYVALFSINQLQSASGLPTFERYDNSFDLKIGEIIIVDSLQITFLNVTEDARCPSDVVCVWQGRASVEVNVKNNERDLGNYIIPLDTGNVLSPELDGHLIKIIDLNPHSTSKQQIKPSEYVATMVISQNGKDPIPSKQTRLELIDGKSYFVSEKYYAEPGAVGIIHFHGINFTNPAYPKSPSPGQSVRTEATFEDGTTKFVIVGPAGPSPPMVIEHNGVYAGMIMDRDSGIHLLVSTDLTKISPLKQFKSGIPIEEIKCKPEFMLVIKNENNLPACVKWDSAVKLNARNWTVSMWLGAGGEESQIQTEKVLRGKDALDVCVALKIPCPSSPIFTGEKIDENNVLVTMGGMDTFYVKQNKTHTCVSIEKTNFSDCKRR